MESVFSLALLGDSVLNPSSFGGEAIKHLFNWYFLAAALIFLSVTFSVIYFSWKYRAKRYPHAKQLFGNTKTELFFTGTALLLVTVFGIYSFNLMYDIQPEVNDSNNDIQPDVIITGHQWWWEVYYPATQSVTANVLHIPANKKILVELHTADVIHSFWIPQVGPKRDMIPGRTNFLWIGATNAGQYEGLCSEFCGAEHAWMRFPVIVESQTDYENWLKAKAMNASEPTDSLALKGKQLFTQKTCSNCHSIRGVTEKANYGPDLTHLSSRPVILAGMFPYNKSNLRAFLQAPDDLKPGVHMPNFILSQQELNALVAYLDQLK